jgi:cytochrome c-type biogenesis protein CcmE
MSGSARADLGAPSTSRRPLPARFVAAGAIALLAFFYLILTGLDLGTAYYLTVSEAKAAGISADSTRVSGDVVPGSIIRAGSEVRFQIADSTGSLPVVYRGVVPDIFGEGIQVVVEGQPDASGTFQADTLLAKCPSKFEAETSSLPAWPPSPSASSRAGHRSSRAPERRLSASPRSSGSPPRSSSPPSSPTTSRSGTSPRTRPATLRSR